MNTQDIRVLESYIKSGNKVMDKFYFDLLCDVLKSSLFKHPETPLWLFDKSHKIIYTNHEHSLKAIALIIEEMNKKKLTNAQKVFIIKWLVSFYNTYTVGNLDLTEIKKLLILHKEMLSSQADQEKLKSTNINKTINQIIRNEVAELEKDLECLYREDRIKVLFKLLSYAKDLNEDEITVTSNTTQVVDNNNK